MRHSQQILEFQRPVIVALLVKFVARQGWLRLRSLKYC